MSAFFLEDGLNTITVIRSTFITIDAFPEDDDLRADLLTMVDEAHGDLIAFLRSCRDEMVVSPFDDPAYFARLREIALRFITQGESAASLDRMLMTGDFAAAGEAVYHYPLHALYSAGDLRNLNDREFAAALLNDLLLTVEEYAPDDRSGSFAPVCRKYLALMFIHYAAADPAWFGRRSEEG